MNSRKGGGGGNKSLLGESVSPLWPQMSTFIDCQIMMFPQCFSKLKKVMFCMLTFM